METSEQAKELIYDILKVSGGKLHKKTALYKAFYFSHLFYWKDNDEVLTDHPIVRMPNGPGIDDAETLLNELVAEDRIRISKEWYGPRQEYVFEVTNEFSVDPNAPRYRAIEKALEFLQGKDAVEMSQDVHNFSKCWHDTYSGQELNIYADLLDDEEYLKMKKNVAVLSQIVDEVFAQHVWDTET